MKMKGFTLLFALCILAGILAGCSGNAPEQMEGAEGCIHRWQPATCMAAKQCTICGETEGEAVDHNYGEWLSNGNQTHTRTCAYNDSHTETAACFGGSTPAVGAVCPDCGYTYDPSHVHAYSLQVVAPNYKATEATCAHGTGYYYTCSCGLVGTDVFYSGQTLAHTEVVDPEKPATFSVAGLTAGSHCDVCGTVIIAQQTIPALGSDVAVGTDYYDKEGQTTYRYSYSFTVYENDRFNLTTLKVGSDESYKLSGEEGKLNYLDNGVYELVFDSGREKMYGKIVGGRFEFCNRDGSKWNDKSERPQGSTAISITPRPGNSVYGYNDLANNIHGKSMQELYYRLYAACEAFVNNREDVAATNGKYVIDRINLDYYVLTADDAIAAWKVFYMENPRYYWMANTLTLSGGMLEVCIDPAYAQGAYRASCDTAIDAMATECAGKITAGMDELKKALTIHDYIISRMNYAYESDGVTPEDAIWAHNMIGCAEKGKGVCESYAKTYQYLCRLNGLECLIVTGVNGENHGWNVVKIGGKWYGVDCTFDETNTDKISYNCFGMPVERMNSEYTADSPSGKGIKYLYQLPELATQGIELVDLYKAGSFVGTYANIDAAFAVMTDVNGEYEIRLYSYEVRGPLLLGTAAVEYHITGTDTPHVKHLTIRGNSIDLENDFYTRNSVYIDTALSLRSNMTIYDLNLVGKGTLDLVDNKILCLGRVVQFCIPVSGNMDSSAHSEIEVAVSDEFVSIFSMKIHTFRVTGDCFVSLLRTVHFKEAYAKFLYLQGGTNEGFYDAQIDCYYAGDGGSITVKDAINLRIGYAEATYCLGISVNIEKVQDFGTIYLGSANVEEVRLHLSGIRYGGIITDMNGNVVGTPGDVMMVDVREIKEPLITLGDRSLFERLSLSIAELGGSSTTALKSINSNNEVFWGR